MTGVHQHKFQLTASSVALQHEQVCTAFGYGENMKFLANSTKGLHAAPFSIAACHFRLV